METTIDSFGVKHVLLPSLFEIGQRVRLVFNEMQTDNAYIRAIIFTTGKIRYSVFLGSSETTLHNIDSSFVRQYPTKEVIEFEFDNFS